MSNPPIFHNPNNLPSNGSTPQNQSTVIDHPLASHNVQSTFPVPPSNMQRSPQARYVQPPMTPPVASIPAAISPPTKLTLDDLADQFLRKDREDAPVQLEPVSPQTNELDRLRILVSRRSWGDVLRQTETLLRGKSHYAPLYEALLRHHPNQPDQWLETQQADLVYILTVHLQALLRLNRRKDLELEVDQWSFCHHNDNSAPAWIPWSLHICAAATLCYTAAQEVDALWSIRKDVSEPMAKLQVDHALANAFSFRKEWRMALVSMQSMLDSLPKACKEYSTKCGVPESVLTTAYSCFILSRQGNLLLQLGAIEEAAKIFELASEKWKAQGVDGSSSVDKVVAMSPGQLSVNEGMIRFSRREYTEALELFRHGVELLKEYSLSDGCNSCLFSLALDVDPQHNLYCETTNNMAICAVYTCRLREALSLMEALIRESPTRYLTERAARNLCTLYELGNESGASSKKKRVIQLIAKRFSVHDISPSCYRI